MEFIDIFDQIVSRRNFWFDRINEEDSDIFFERIEGRNWTIEEIFRHILWNLKSMHDLIADENMDKDAMMLKTDEHNEKDVDIDELKNRLENITMQVRNKIVSTEELIWKEQIETYYGDTVSIESQFCSILLHEVEHHGQIRQIFKRLTGLDDSEIYKVEQ